MYTGTLINDLIATVERAERHLSTQDDAEELSSWAVLASQELLESEANLVGVA